MTYETMGKIFFVMHAIFWAIFIYVALTPPNYTTAIVKDQSRLACDGRG